MNRVVQHKQALKLRLAGKSYNEINSLLNIPKSTLSNWFGSLQLPDSAKDRLKKRVAEGTLKGLVKRNKLQTLWAQERAETTRKSSYKEIKKLDDEDLKLIGIALYWAEGYKKLKTKNGKIVTNHPISFTNSDPDMVKFFVSFVKKFMGIPKEKISVNLRLFKHIEGEAAIKYWREITGLESSNFDKPCYIISKSSQGKRPFNQLPYGTIQIRVNDTVAFYRLIGWIDGIKDRIAYISKKS